MAIYKKPPPLYPKISDHRTGLKRFTNITNLQSIVALNQISSSNILPIATISTKLITSITP